MSLTEDQAEGLRDMKSIAGRPRVPKTLRCIAVGSGKGGVGKTVVSVGLSVCLARMNYRVLVLDADLGLANVDIQVGVDPKFTMQDVIFGHCRMADAIMSVEKNFDLLPSSSGMQEMVDMGDARRQMFVNDLVQFAAGYDFLVIDVAAGIGRDITTFLAAAPEVLVVVANEPTSIMDAYSLIKILRNSNDPPSVMTVINMVRSIDEGEQLAARLDGITQRFMGVKLPLAGMVLYDEKVGDAVRARRPVVSYSPGSMAAKGLEELARFVVSGQALSGNSARLNEKFFKRFADVGLKGVAENVGVDK